MDKLSKKHGKLDHVEYKTLKFEDLGKDIGIRRNVDLIVLVFENGDKVQFTASIDRRSQLRDPRKINKEDQEKVDPKLSPTARETEALQKLNRAGISSVQTIYGDNNIEILGGYTSRRIRNPKRGCYGTKFINFKEYIEGQMLIEYVAEPELAAELIGRDIFAEIAYKTGRAVAEVIEKTGEVVCDSHPANLIVGEKNGAIYVRYCDVNELSPEAKDKEFEIRTLRERFRTFAADFMRGINGPK